jgi:hypothetical protein
LYAKKYNDSIDMNLKKIIFGTFVIVILNGCTQTTALLGPAYTLSSTGNVFQAGLSYGSNKIITSATGKSASDNLKKIIKKNSSKKVKNFNKKSSINDDFYNLVKANIEKTSKIIDLSNQ